MNQVTPHATTMADLDTPLQPVGDDFRIRAIDAVRGFALAGVVTMNLFELPEEFAPPKILSALPTARIDDVVGLIERWAMVGKAQFLFGVLFGLGFAIFVQRAQAAGRLAGGFLFRRIAVLFVFGLVNTFALFFGDILHIYAIVALLCPLALLLPDMVLLVAGFALVLFAAPASDLLVKVIFGVSVEAYTRIHVPGLVTALWQAFTSRHYAAVPEMGSDYLKVNDLSARAPVRYGYIAGQFFIGFWLYRSRVLTKVLEQRNTLGRVAIGGLPLGLGLSALLLLLPGQNMPGKPLHGIADLFTAAGYAALVALLTTRANALVSVLAAYGRMALTQYLIHGVVVMALLSRLGFGLIGRCGATSLLVIGLVVVAVQAATSVVWFRYYRFGPMEWIWRSLTYAKRQPVWLPR